MSYPTLLPLLLLIWSGLVHAAPPCSRQGFDDLNRDKANTAYFLDHVADQACLNKPWSGSGAVNQVYAKDEFEILAEDGLRVTVLLTGRHGCGDLLNLKKGARVTVRGTVARTYRSIAALRLREASCQ